MSARAARAERLGGYFDLQLQLAERMAAVSGRPLADTVLVYTNLHRRLGLGMPKPPAAAWGPFVERLTALPTRAERVVWTQETYAAAPDEPIPPGQTRFGCFACEPADDEGAVRIHFYNREQDDEVGPLGLEKLPRRRSELTAMFGHVRATWPQAQTLRGASWLYHIEAYRRLFPEAYVASRQPISRHIPLQGTSTWGQLIDHRELVRPGPAAAFTANLERLDPEAPWFAFPLRALETQAPLALFYEFYGVTT